MKTDDLIPPDPARCQADVIEHTPFALGGTHRKYRCEMQAAYIVEELRPGPDGKKGSMSLCPHCLGAFKAMMGEDYATVTPIKAKDIR